MSWLDMLIGRAPNTIRRFHATGTSKLPQIVKEGLKPMDPGAHGGIPGTGVYTSVYPDYFHESPGEAVIAIDIPKDAYRQMYRLPHNPETPPSRYGMGTARRLQNDIDYYERFIIDTINDKGRVDIFGQDRLKPEWFTDIVYVGPDYNIYRYKPQSQTKMLNWDMLDMPYSEQRRIRPFDTNDEFLIESSWK